MGVVIRQSFWASLITYSGVIIGYVNTLILFPYYLDEEQFGLVRLVQSSGMILIPLAIIGMNGAYTKFYPEFQDSKNLTNRIFSFQTVVVALGSLFFTGIIFLFRDQIEAFYEENSSLYNKYLHVTIIIFVSQSFFNYFIAFLWSKHNIVLTNFLQEIFLRLVSTGIIAMYGFGVIDFSSMVLLIGLSYILTTLILYIYIFLFHGIRFDWHFYQLHKTWIGRLISFGANIMLMTASASIILNVSYIITSHLDGLAASGILTIAVYIGSVTELPHRALVQIMSPVVTDSFKKGDMINLSKQHKLASLNLGLFGALIAIGVLTNLHDLFSVIPDGKSYYGGFWVVAFICTAKLVNMLGGVSGEIVTFSSFYRVNIVVAILGALAIVTLNSLLIPIMGITGAGISALATSLLTQCIRQGAIYYHLKIHPYTSSHIKLIALAVGTFLIAKLLPSLDNAYFSIAYRSVVTASIFLATSYALGISQLLNEMVNAFINRSLGRRK